MGIESALMMGFAGGMGALDNMSKGKKAPPGGGIPGLTSSKGSGKDGTEGSVVQVDPTIALNYFKDASKLQEEGYNKGLSYYGPALKKAGEEVQKGFQAANSTLMPLSYSSNQALNEQMRMLGLDPIQGTAGFGDAMRFAVSQSGVLDPGQKEYALSVANAMDTASTIKDKGERAAYKANIQAMSENAFHTFTEQQQNQLNEIINKQDGPADPEEFNKWYAKTADEWAKARNTFQGMDLDPMIKDLYENDPERAAEKAALSAKREDINKELASSQGYLSDLQSGIKDFMNKYTDEYDAGYTGSQVAEKIANVPGYKFQLNQGSLGLERKAAATGMAASANTQAALQEFGQQQAMSYYNNYLSQLSGITAQGAGATAQISANQAQEGGALGQLAQLYGQAQMDTARQIANYGAQSLADSGKLFNETAMFNAQLQFAGQQNDKNRGSQQALQGPAMMNAQTNAGQLGLAQQQFQQQLINSQNFGQGYLGQSSGGYGSGGSTNSALNQYYSSGGRF